MDATENEVLTDRRLHQTDNCGAEYAREVADAAGPVEDAAASSVPMNDADAIAETTQAIAATAAMPALMPEEKTMDLAEAHAEPFPARSIAATAKATAARRNTALAALDERLGPLRAERAAIDAALASALAANAHLRARLAA